MSTFIVPPSYSDNLYGTKAGVGNRQLIKFFTRSAKYYNVMVM